MKCADVRAVFLFYGDDYDRPTPEAIRRAVTTLTRLATAWGAPAPLLTHHRTELDAVIAALPRAA